MRNPVLATTSASIAKVSASCPQCGACLSPARPQSAVDAPAKLEQLLVDLNRVLEILHKLHHDGAVRQGGPLGRNLLGLVERGLAGAERERSFIFASSRGVSEHPGILAYWRRKSDSREADRPRGRDIRDILYVIYVR